MAYKSEDKIAEGSAEEFVGKMIRSGHESVLEHGNLIFMCSSLVYEYIRTAKERIEETGGFAFLRFTKEDGYKRKRHIVSGNVRAWRDFIRGCQKFDLRFPKALVYQFSTMSVLFGDLVKFDYDASVAKMEKKAEKHFKRIGNSDLLTGNELKVHYCVTARFTTNRGVSHEIVRHRPAAYTQSSTRYCNYSGDKFGNEITVIDPGFWPVDDPRYELWHKAVSDAEKSYMDLIDAGAAPQEARDVLNNALMTEVVMTTNLAEWHHYLKLRTSKGAHPHIREISSDLLDIFKQDIKIKHQFDGIEVA